MLRYSKYVTALLYVVFYIFVCTLVCHLCHSYLLAGKLVVEVKKLKTWRWKLLERWSKHGSLERWHRSLEIRRN